MIREVVVNRFKIFHHRKFGLPDMGLIAGPNNSGKTTLLQALATWAELGEIWLDKCGDLVRSADGDFQHVEVDLAEFGTLALSSFDQLWHDQETREPISIEIDREGWNIGFGLHYRDSSMAIVGPLKKVSEDHLEAYAKTPLRVIYISSLSGMDVNEPEYSDKVLATRLAHGKGGTVLRNMVRIVSRDDTKWLALRNTVSSFFGFELSVPSGADPIIARYRHSPQDHWYDLANGAAGFLQTVLVRSALL